jgi:cell filamentation protein
MFIHRWLFQDVYSWAGTLRTVPINKGGSEFAQPAYITGETDRVVTELHQEAKLLGTTERQLPGRLAYYFGELNALHPFREGNGRVQRLFLRHLLELRRLTLAWDRVSAEEMVDVSVAVHRGDERPARLLFERIIESF